MLPSGQKLFNNFLLLFLAVCLALAGAEFLLRLLVQWGIEPGWKYQRIVLEGKTHNPQHKILILGDSFAVHWESGYSLYELLVKDLRSYGVSLLDTAEGGFGPVDYLTQLRAFGPKYHPDTVLLFYYVGNDLTSVQYGGDLWKQFKKNLKPWATRFRLFYLIDNLRGQWFQDHLKYEDAKKRGIDQKAFQLAKERKINPWLLDLSREKKNYILDNVLMETPENMKAWSETEGLLREIRSFSQKIHARLILVLIPHSVQINSSHFPFYERLAFAMDERTLTSDKPQILMKKFCEDEKIACLDLLPEFRKDREKEFFRDNDDHFNEAGFRLAEKQVLEFLMAHSNWANHGS